MTQESAREHYLTLCNEIEDHDYSYYVLHRPRISDYEYDMKIRKLLQIEESHPEWKVLWSPSNRLGDRPSGHFSLVHHKEPMLSIANSYSLEELREFFSKIEKFLGKSPSYTIELKIDGIAVAIRYEDHILTQALTRGNGKQGEDITANIRTIRSLPLKLPKDAPQFLEVRGEVFFSYSTFQTINDKQQDLKKSVFANPRNAAGGTLKLLSPQEVAKRKLEISIYNVIASENSDSHYQNLQNCIEWGLPVSGRPRLCSNPEEVISVLQNIETERSFLPMEIDGAVIKVDSLESQKLLGVTGKHYRWAIAYKYAPEEAETILEDIIVQVGRTGVLTPVAKLTPVLLSGSLISRASLYNEDEIHRKDIRIGDTVCIAKGGEVIPKVIRVCKEKRSKCSQVWNMPEWCPVCHSQVVREEDKVSVRCINPKCMAGAIEKIRFFVSRSALNIEHLGIKVITKLFELGIIHTRVDLFLLTAEDLMQVPGIRERSAKKILESITQARNVDLDRFLVALGIPYIGVGVATVLARHFETLERLISADVEELLSLEGIGEKVAHAILNYFSDANHLNEIRKMQDLGVRIFHYHKPGSECSGKVFVITGTLLGISRSDAEAAIRSCGGRTASSVSKQTDYLVVGTNPGSKLKKAKDLGVCMLDQDAFTNLVDLK
ncbi:DNA ligase,NAD-dependent DNA ligase LigA,3-methyladenine DNA glycosylase,DNA ligase, NAD-dependent,NAD-dependent DNA ligase adenylation domain [Chlamydia serpentis]|uniref:DNA ligase n=1 Tax=Chlamydia serpentis TaxID=1967782 RepID=A0A2R8FA55_9CHLA|nr:NAD-dependent DNA ligase LigA [Chlamydia serpentis]SPN73310.1 DNA ligase,NAD-dependent DNA ligase LigA,3-methyladenine DNA glycosylase,DNA ligase, NAD-dependent,NAD-dependent DNA ligase adenylation domain [Chlamydia serpentis]